MLPYDTSVFYKKLKNVSCEYDRLNGWNSTLQAAWYTRHVRIIWFLWTKPTLWFINPQFYTKYLHLHIDIDMMDDCCCWVGHLFFPMVARWLQHGWQQWKRSATLSERRRGASKHTNPSSAIKFNSILALLHPPPTQLLEISEGFVFAALL